MRLGDLDAETDADLLHECFLDNGDLAVLRDVNNPASIILGRTGAGKTALLLEIMKSCGHTKLLDPNDISIRFLESSDIVQFFSSMGVKLDLFYRLLWRHVITVELLKLRYDIKNEEQSEGMLSKIFGFASKDKVKEEALSYFREWGDSFWVDTDEQIKKITDKLSEDVRAGIRAKFPNFDINIDSGMSQSQEVVSEIKSLATKVVSKIQIKKLSDVIDLLEERVFGDNKWKYYLLVDKLDEDWASTETRCRFIRALIEEIKTFRKISNVKIIISMRKDLLDLVFDKTRDAGFQQEKYESYLHPVIWNNDSLGRLLDKRVSEVFRRQYTKSNVRFDDVFAVSRRAGQIPIKTYMIQRTLNRPRDIIQFANECFVASAQKEKVTWRGLYAAEANYSDKRLKSLFEEWSEIYPSLDISVEILRGMPETFSRSSITEDRVMQVASDLLERDNDDSCAEVVRRYCEPGRSAASLHDVVSEFVRCLYRVGALGVKLDASQTMMWSDYDHAILSRGDVKRVKQLKIHSMLHRALGVFPDDKGGR